MTYSIRYHTGDFWSKAGCTYHDELVKGKSWKEASFAWQAKHPGLAIGSIRECPGFWVRLWRWLGSFWDVVITGAGRSYLP